MGHKSWKKKEIGTWRAKHRRHPQVVRSGARHYYTATGLSSPSTANNLGVMLGRPFC